MSGKCKHKWRLSPGVSVRGVFGLGNINLRPVWRCVRCGVAR